MNDEYFHRTIEKKMPFFASPEASKSRKKVILLFGVRQTGKSTLLKRWMAISGGKTKFNGLRSDKSLTDGIATLRFFLMGTPTSCRLSFRYRAGARRSQVKSLWLCVRDKFLSLNFTELIRLNTALDGKAIFRSARCQPRFLIRNLKAVLTRQHSKDSLCESKIRPLRGIPTEKAAYSVFCGQS